MKKHDCKSCQKRQKKIDRLEHDYQTLQQVVSLMPGNVYWKSINGVYLGCNNNCAKLIDLMPEDIVGKTLYELTNKKFADEMETTDKQIMKSGIPNTLEEKTTNLDGTDRTYLSQKSPLVDKNGKVYGLHGVSLEITELKNTQKALTEAKEKAEAANIAKSEFLRNISHDLRTPFNGILSFSELLLTLEKDPQKKEMLECMSISSKQLISIVNEILELSCIDMGQASLKENKIDVRDMISKIKSLYSYEIKTSKNKITTSVSSSVPKILIGDESRIKRILLNLLGNAIKFTHKGNITIQVSKKKTQKDKHIISFTITDTGIGIPKNKYDVIFDKFSRLHYSDSSSYEGLGLGLYIVNRFVKDLNGEIKVASKVGKGSTFTCDIPLK